MAKKWPRLVSTTVRMLSTGRCWATALQSSICCCLLLGPMMRLILREVMRPRLRTRTPTRVCLPLRLWWRLAWSELCHWSSCQASAVDCCCCWAHRCWHYLLTDSVKEAEAEALMWGSAPGRRHWGMWLERDSCDSLHDSLVTAYLEARHLVEDTGAGDWRRVECVGEVAGVQVMLQHLVMQHQVMLQHLGDTQHKLVITHTINVDTWEWEEDSQPCYHPGLLAQVSGNIAKMMPYVSRGVCRPAPEPLVTAPNMCAGLWSLVSTCGFVKLMRELTR